MAIDFLSPIDYNGVPSIAFAVPLASSDPDGYTGGIYYNTTTGELRYWNGSKWVVLGEAGSGGPPSGIAGGEIKGNYPDQIEIADGVIDNLNIKDNAAIAQSKISGLTTALNGKAANTITVTGGAGLDGGGNLTANRTINVVGAVDGGITVNPDSIQIDRDTVDNWYDPKGAADLRVLKVGDTMSGNLDMTGNKVVALPGAGATTFTENDAAPIWYVDQHTVGLKPIEPARLLARTKIDVLSGLQTIDDFALAEGDRVLLTQQHAGSTVVGDGFQNGVWLASAGAWTRAPDVFEAGNFIYIQEGTLWEGTGHLVLLRDEQAPWGPGDDNYWLQLHTRPGLDVGNGLVQTGKRVDVVTAAGGGLVATEDDVSINRNVTDTWYVQPTRAINTDNTTISGGGNLSANRTLSVVAAPKWSTARSITLAGEVVGTTTIDGSQNVTINTTVAGATNLVNQASGEVGAGVNVPFTHNLGTRDVSVTVYRNSAPYDSVLVDVDRTDTNQITLKFAEAVTAAQYRVVVQGK